MKLKNCRMLGRYKKPEGGNVNVYKGCKVGYGVDVLYYLFRGKRMLISDAEFYGANAIWKRVE